MSMHNRGWAPGWLAVGLLSGVACVGKIDNTVGGGGGAGAALGNGTLAYAMVRLTNNQYLNTVQDLFPGATLPAVTLPNENVIDGFTNAASGQTVTSLLVSDYQSAAEATRFYNFYQVDRASDTFPVAMGAVVQVFLQSPYFVYRLEGGQTSSPAQTGGASVPLSAYEVASRLSYFLTNSMPESTLMAAADANLLQTADQVETQARRLLMGDRARAAAATFNYQWLNMVKMEGLTKDATAFPSMTPQIAQALHDSTVQFADYAFWIEDSLSAMLTDTHAFVNDSIAPYYGLQPVGSSTLQMVSVDPTQRAGILTQAGLLAGLAGPVNDSPVQRGLLILNSFLCAAPPPPPA